METSTSHPTVAVLGTGIMGAPMARNIAAAGMPVRAWNRTRSRADPLAAEGVTVVDTPSDAVVDADVIVTMLSDGDTVERVMSRLEEPPGGAIWAQTSTVGVAATERLAALAEELSLVFVDAPVLGTRGPAESGTLTVLAAGGATARNRFAPVAEAIGARTRWFDAVGAATRLKLVANGWVLALTSATGEAIALAEGLGVDPRDFLELVSGGPLDAGYLHVKAQTILGGDFTPSFTVTNAEKDARLLMEAGAASGIRLDLAAASAERLRRAAAGGHADDDMAAGYFASFPGEG